MTDVVTSRHIAAERQRLCQLLDETSGRLKEAARKHAIAEHSYRQAHAVALLAASGTAVDKKSRADTASSESMRERNEWRAEELWALEECRNLRQQLSTLAAEAYSVNSEIRLAGVS